MELTLKQEMTVVMIAIVVIKSLHNLCVPPDRLASLGIRLADRLMKLDLDKDEDRLVEDAKAELNALLMDDACGH